MTPDQLTELAQRLRDHAAMHESIVPNDDEQRQWRDDLLDAAEYLSWCAEAALDCAKKLDAAIDGPREFSGWMDSVYQKEQR